MKTLTFTRCVNRLGLALRRNIQNRSFQLGGLALLGIAALIGVTQAGSMRHTMMGTASSFAAIQASAEPAQPAAQPVRNISSGIDSRNAGKPMPRSNALNLVDMIEHSEFIVRGMVKGLSDGIENGVPYTEVTLHVSEAIRGELPKEYKFRQFGLLQPKKMGDGRVNMNVTPDGWAKFEQGESVVLFLYKQASKTGLRTTVGLGQGKINFKGGNVENQFGNVGLFEDVAVDSSLTNDADKRVLATKKGPVNQEAFMALLRRAVSENWVRGGLMRHAK